MEVRMKYQTLAKCHPEDIWHVFSQLEQWHTWTDIFGNAGWVQGQPWQPGSRFFLELLYPRELDLEVMVVKCHPPNEVVLLPHGSGYAAQQWIQFAKNGFNGSIIRTEEHFVGSERFKEPEVQQQLMQMFERWFKPLAAQCELHCKTYTL